MDNIDKLIHNICTHKSNTFTFRGIDLNILKIYVKNQTGFSIKINNFQNIKKKLSDLIILYKDILYQVSNKHNKKCNILLDDTRKLILKNIINNHFQTHLLINDNFEYTTQVNRPIENVVNEFKEMISINDDHTKSVVYNLPHVPTDKIDLYESMFPKAPGM